MSFNFGLRHLADSSINAAKNKCADSPEWLRSYSAPFFALFVLVVYVHGQQLKSFRDGQLIMTKFSRKNVPDVGRSRVRLQQVLVDGLAANRANAPPF